MYIEKVKELGLLEPKQGEKQAVYIKRLLLSGYKFDTRQARFIGIGNLHSLLSNKSMKNFPHTVEHKRVIDPATGKIPPNVVDVVYMTVEQIQAYRQKNAPTDNDQGI